MIDNLDASICAYLDQRWLLVSFCVCPLDARALHNSQIACISETKDSRYLLGVDTTALISISLAGASSPQSQSQSSPQPPVLHSPA